MNFGECPYCDKFLGLFDMPDSLPTYAKVRCDSCGKEVWYRFSKIAPCAWTVEEFERLFVFDEKTKQLRSATTEPECCNPPFELEKENEHLKQRVDRLETAISDALQVITNIGRQALGKGSK
jgi:hypothetical protein